MAARLSTAGRCVTRLAVFAVFAALAMLTALLAGCASSPVAARPTPTPGPSMSASLAVLEARARIEAALRAAGLGLIDAHQEYRPPETPALASAPRAVYQVVLPQDPDHGDVVIYDLGDPDAAASAGRAYAGYVGSGPIRVQFAPDSQFVLQQLGSTLVFYSWSGSNTVGPEAARAGQVLATVGQPIPIR